MDEMVYLGLGTNLGEKTYNLKKAICYLNLFSEINIRKTSSVYESPPWGNQGQPYFYNQVLEIETTLTPVQLLMTVKNIEINMGRQKREKWGPREIDIDILLFGDRIIKSDQLTIPHPHMRERLFVLLPLQEINAGFVFPDDGADIGEVLDRVSPREKQCIKKI